MSSRASVLTVSASRSPAALSLLASVGVAPIEEVEGLAGTLAWQLLLRLAFRDGMTGKQFAEADGPSFLRPPVSQEHDSWSRQLLFANSPSGIEAASAR